MCLTNIFLSCRGDNAATWEDDSCLHALLGLTHIPTHPALEQYVVGEDDPLQRKSLVGQKGVKASQRTTSGHTRHVKTCIRRIRIVTGSARVIIVCLSDKGNAWGWLQSYNLLTNVVLS